MVGQGRLGRALTDALRGVGVDVAGIAARALPDTLSSEAYVLAVRDPTIADTTRAVLARHLGAEPIVLHTAGGVPSRVLREAGVAHAAVMHPLVSFAGSAPLLRGALFAIEGDPGAAGLATELAERLGARPLRLDATALVRYHAGATLAANHVLALVDLGRELLESVGADPALAQAGVASLFGGVAVNLGALGLPAALTGPIARGDVAAVRGHLEALPGEARVVYATTGRRLCAIARAQGTRAADVDAIEALLALYAPAFVD